MTAQAWRGDPPQPPEVFAAQAAQALADATAEEIVQWAADTFDDRLCLTSSMTDAVLIHLASVVQPGIDVIFLETGYHFAETIGMRDARDPDLCCAMRKVQPLERTLRQYDAWITGVRREETPSRRHAKAVEWDARRQMVKVNPIVGWTQDQVDEYIDTHGILVNPLVPEGYPSIGCATCTLRVEPGADPRSGRWAGTGKSECGIHD
jgi:phosphoadenosine phosphosulfate reductase